MDDALFGSGLLCAIASGVLAIFELWWPAGGLVALAFVLCAVFA